MCRDKRFACCVNEKIKSFYKASNAIFRIDGSCDDMILLRLVESHCVSILTYAIEVIHKDDVALRGKLRVAYNSVFRRIFRYRQFESVSALQAALGGPTWEEPGRETGH